MKINRFVALAVIGLLVVGAMGALTYRAYAHGHSVPSAQTQDCANQDDDSAEVQGADTDTVELECGDQNDADDENVVDAPDSDDVEEQVGGQDAAETGAETEEAADSQESAPTGTPAITAEAAQAAALAAHPGTVIQTELDDEDEQLVYSVEFEGDVDVKVDAMTGEVLGVETGQD